MSKAMYNDEKERHKFVDYWLHRIKHTNIGVIELIDLVV
jgi:hypothetical protein